MIWQPYSAVKRLYGLGAGLGMMENPMVKKREHETEATCSIWGLVVRATVENQLTSQEAEFAANPFQDVKAIPQLVTLVMIPSPSK